MYEDSFIYLEVKNLKFTSKTTLATKTELEKAKLELETRLATLVIITSSLFLNMSATAGGLFWLRGFSLGGAWLMMGELMKMIVMIKNAQICHVLQTYGIPKEKL